MNTDIRAIHEKLMLMSEATKLMREAEQRESKLWREKLEKSGSLSHSEMIRQQRIQARLERLQLHYQAKLGLC